MRWLRSNGIITFFGRTLLTLHSIMTVPCLTFFCLITLGIFPVFFIRSSPLVFSYSVIVSVCIEIVYPLSRQLSRHCRDYFPDTVWTFVRSRILPTFSPIRSSSTRTSAIEPLQFLIERFQPLTEIAIIFHTDRNPCAPSWVSGSRPVPGYGCQV
jgi:hypothetical protein